MKKKVKKPALLDRYAYGNGPRGVWNKITILLKLLCLDKNDARIETTRGTNIIAQSQQT